MYATQKEILDALPDADAQAIAISEVHRRVACWSRGTVERWLRDLEHEGLAQSELVPRPGRPDLVIRVVKRAAQHVARGEKIIPILAAAE